MMQPPLKPYLFENCAILCADEHVSLTHYFNMEGEQTQFFLRQKNLWNIYFKQSTILILFSIDIFLTIGRIMNRSKILNVHLID